MLRPGRVRVADRRNIFVFDDSLKMAAVTSRCFGGWRTHLSNDKLFRRKNRVCVKSLNVVGRFDWRGLERAWGNKCLKVYACIIILFCNN